MKKFLSYKIVLACALLLCYSCRDEYTEDGMPKFYSLTFTIEFLHNGTNIVDSLHLYEDVANETSAYVKLTDEDKYVSATVIRERDKKEVDYDIKQWIYVSDSSWGYANIADHKSPEIPRTYLYMRCIDNDIINWKQERDEIFCLNVRSQKIFKDNEEHTLRLFIHLYADGKTPQVTKLEIEGTELPLEKTLVKGLTNRAELFIDWKL